MEEEVSMEVEVTEEKMELLREKLGGLIAAQLRDSREALIMELLTIPTI